MKELYAAIDSLNAYYGNAGFSIGSESAEAINLQSKRPVNDPQASNFRSKARIFNELAISHQAAVRLGASKFHLPDDSVFAIRSIELSIDKSSERNLPSVFLCLEVSEERSDVVSCLKSTLIAQKEFNSHKIVTLFSVLPRFLVNFVRRTRNFADFEEINIPREKPFFSKVAENHLRYFPAEIDRLSGGVRMDHVPALNLIDIAFLTQMPAFGDPSCTQISAHFQRYADPRQPIEVYLKNETDGKSVVEFVQDGKQAAIIRCRN